MKRIEQVNELIKEELGRVILKEVDFPLGVLVTISRIETSLNLIQARSYISCVPEEKSPEVLKILNKEVYRLQQKLNQRLKMRPVPKIKFIGEKKTIEAARIEEILEELKKDKK